MQTSTIKPNTTVFKNMFTHIKDQFSINSYRVDISTSCLHELEQWENLLFHSLVGLSLALIVYAALEPYINGPEEGAFKSSDFDCINLSLCVDDETCLLYIHFKLNGLQEKSWIFLGIDNFTITCKYMLYKYIFPIKISLTLGQSTNSTGTSALNLPSSTNISNNSTSTLPPVNSTTTNPINSTNSTSSTNSNLTIPSLIVPYNTVEVPPNNGTWAICSNNATKYISYSVKVVNGSYPITPGYGTTSPGTSSPLPTAPEVGIIARIQYANTFKFIPSLSCYLQFVTECDQDTGNIPIQDNEKYCLDIINSGPKSQIVNITISFTKSSVFGGGGFTSANKPGGNIQSSTWCG
ncbi:1988_t:CDS:2 [Scutellospora calospora]|uniref:1988_t:CDS:1 n=1 Tax=Scutellospora calospora TaxID=85575 RepID=A0ACA9K994_9GLOM|nr:1988_t:CDS:2 [Scutellospora calospora]